MPTYIARSKRVRAMYVVLLCVALVCSGFAIYNQFASDSTAADLANQVAQVCHSTPSLAKAQGLNCEQARGVQDSDAPALGTNPGPKGEKGEKGDVGEQGPKGDKGDTGLVGPQGSVGSTGAKGEQGVPGKDGTGLTGPQGPQGEVGPSGPKGDKGDTGERGSDGSPAPQISAIDFVGTIDDCRFVVTFTDNSQVSTPVRGELCI